MDNGECSNCGFNSYNFIKWCGAGYALVKCRKCKETYHLKLKTEPVVKIKKPKEKELDIKLSDLK